MSHEEPTYPRGWLKNGNPPGDPNTAPRCGAHARTTGNPCQQPAMPNGRCRLHGGKSTGPKTREGLERSRKANWKHGEYSIEGKEEMKALRMGRVLLINPKALLPLSLVELIRYEIALARLLDKIQRGLIRPYR